VQEYRCHCASAIPQSLRLDPDETIDLAATSHSYDRVSSASIGPICVPENVPIAGPKQVKAMDHWQLDPEPENPENIA
jgi:hypothetical protein